MTRPDVTYIFSPVLVQTRVALPCPLPPAPAERDRHQPMQSAASGVWHDKVQLIANQESPALVQLRVQAFEALAAGGALKRITGVGRSPR